MVIFKKYSTGSSRFWAACIDGWVLFPIDFSSLNIDYFHSKFAIWLTLILITCLPYIYSILMHWKYGQTLGKMAIGIKIIDNLTETNITLCQAIYRDSVGILIAIIGLLYVFGIFIINPKISISDTINNDFLVWICMIWILIELVTMYTNAKRRAVHDFIANTVVVFKKRHTTR